MFNEIEEWESDTDKMMHMLPLYGNMFRCVFFDPVEKRITTSIYSPEEFLEVLNQEILLYCIPAKNYLALVLVM